MPNNVETKMWLISKEGTEASVEQAEEFFSQFISIDPNAKPGKEPRFFDFSKVIPFPENIWLGDVGGPSDENLKNIEALGGLEAVKQGLREDKKYPQDMHPCLREEQIAEFGMVCGLEWCRENWNTKWNAYYCCFSWGDRHGDDTSAHLAFYTAWSVPEAIIRKVRAAALEQGFDIQCDFGGELDCPGEYEDGLFMYWNATWNEKTGEMDREGDPVDVHE